MDMNILVLILIVVGGSLAKKDYTVEFQKFEVIQFDEDYFASIDAAVERYNSTTIIFNATFDLIKDFPLEAICSAVAYEKKSNKYIMSVVQLPPKNCCEMIQKDARINPILRQNTNWDGECPIKKGFYHIYNYVCDDESMPDKVLLGKWRINIKAELNGHPYMKIALYVETKPNV